MLKVLDMKDRFPVSQPISMDTNNTKLSFRMFADQAKLYDRLVFDPGTDK
jgi:hypothetical protein